MSEQLNMTRIGALWLHRGHVVDGSVSLSRQKALINGRSGIGGGIVWIHGEECRCQRVSAGEYIDHINEFIAQQWHKS